MATILSDQFPGTTVPPNNWMQFSGVAKDIAHTPGDVTLTDSTGTSTGILSTPSVFKPAVPNLKTTIKAQINKVSETPSLGNAIVGLVGVNQTGSLAAGIDGQGNVFFVFAQANPAITQANKVIGKDSKYNGGATELTFLVYQDSVQVKTSSFTSEVYTYSQLSTKFSLTDAFKDGAIPALAAASQPKAKSGVASFESITVSTA